MKFLAAVIAVFCCAAASLGQVPLDKNVLVDPATNNIDVYLQPKSVEGWNDASKWMVIAVDASNNVRKVDLSQIQAATDGSMFSLVPADKSATSPIATAAQLIIKFGPKTLTIYQVKPPSPGPSSTPESNKQKADLYISGTYSPAINSDPQYSIDGSVGLMWDLSGEHPEYGQLGFLGAVKTDKRKKVDPDSYRLFLAYQNTPVSKFHGPLQGVLFTWLPAGVEFDRKADNVNFITAPSLDFPIRLFPKFIRATTEPMAVLTPTVGFEAGHNFHNAVTPDTGRGVFRGVAGASLIFRFNPKLPGFKGVELSSSYALRLPALREIYTLTKKVDGKDVDDPFLGKNPRHYAKTDLNFKLTDAFSFTIKHEYGAIPPAFRKVDNKLSFGFTYGIRQLRNGVPTALRSK
jgi:hypothetical protein